MIVSHPGRSLHYCLHCSFFRREIISSFILASLLPRAVCAECGRSWCVPPWWFRHELVAFTRLASQRRSLFCSFQISETLSHRHRFFFERTIRCSFPSNARRTLSGYLACTMPQKTAAGTVILVGVPCTLYTNTLLLSFLSLCAQTVVEKKNQSIS